MLDPAIIARVILGSIDTMKVVSEFSNRSDGSFIIGGNEFAEEADGHTTLFEAENIWTAVPLDTFRLTCRYCCTLGAEINSEDVLLWRCPVCTREDIYVNVLFWVEWQLDEATTQTIVTNDQFHWVPVANDEYCYRCLHCDSTGAEVNNATVRRWRCSGCKREHDEMGLLFSVTRW